MNMEGNSLSAWTALDALMPNASSYLLPRRMPRKGERKIAIEVQRLHFVQRGWVNFPVCWELIHVWPMPEPGSVRFISLFDLLSVR